MSMTCNANKKAEHMECSGVNRAMRQHDVPEEKFEADDRAENDSDEMSSIVYTGEDPSAANDIEDEPHTQQEVPGQ